MSRGRRIAIGVAAAITAAIVAVVLTAVIGPGESDLARAAGRMRARSAVSLVDMAISTGGRAFSLKGRSETRADGSRRRFRGTLQDTSQSLPIKDVGIGGEHWVSFPDMPRMLPAGKHWVHLADRNAVPSTLTPSQLARVMVDAADVGKVADRQTVDGVPTTEYRGLVSFRELAAEIGGQTRARLERILGSGDVKVPIRAWIGRDGLPRRLAITWRVGRDWIDAAFDMVRYGVKVDPPRPPAASVVEEDDWLAYLRSRRSS